LLVQILEKQIYEKLSKAPKQKKRSEERFESKIKVTL